MSLSTTELEAIIANKDRQLGRAQALLERVVRVVAEYDGNFGNADLALHNLATACDNEARSISPSDYADQPNSAQAV